MPLLVTADDIKQALVKTDAQANALDAVFTSCATLNPATKSEWAAWLAGYRKFSTDNSDLGFFTLGLAAIADEELSYQRDLHGWQNIANAQCGGGKAIAPSGTPQDQVNEQGNPGPPGAGTELLKAIPWIVGGGLALVAAIYVLPWLPRPRRANGASRRR